jgi:superfamily II DNA/RNA helicase
MYPTSAAIIFTSPPASGKTYWIQSFVKETLSDPPLIISPLRALADECRARWPGLNVQTPEEWLMKPVPSRVVIFDEFHLHFYWGDGFRQRMWEVFYALAAEAELVIMLTATLNPAMRSVLERYSCNFDEIIWCDHGNQRLKTPPARYHQLPRREVVERILFEDHRKGTTLVFCRYRQEVALVAARLRARGFRVWSCVGGEAGKMAPLMSSGETPDYIVSTTVLSHGVNLPSLQQIFFLYRLDNLDFWIQMVARGGRRGEAYEVFAIDPYPGQSRWDLRPRLASALPRLRSKLLAWVRSGESVFLNEST